MSSLRAERVVKAFIGCVQAGIYTREYAVTLIEDNGRYGFLTEADKQEFYTACPEAVQWSLVERSGEAPHCTDGTLTEPRFSGEDASQPEAPAQITEELPSGNAAEPTQTPAEETDGTDN